MRRQCIIMMILGGFIGSNAFALCTGVSDAVLRAGAGTQFPQTSWTLKKYTPLQKLDPWDDWYHVADVEGDQHWVHQQDLLENTFCFIIKVEKALLREGPGPQYPYLREAQKYEVFRFSRHQGEWTQGISEKEEYVWVISKDIWVQ
ncbi:SH3 domain-containing protein [Deltaproteobacteria bacterium TL4]